MLFALRIIKAASPQAVGEVPPDVTFLGISSFLDERNATCFPLGLQDSHEPRKCIDLDARG
jgi:hypothetical protein